MAGDAGFKPALPGPKPGGLSLAQSPSRADRGDRTRVFGLEDRREHQPHQVRVVDRTGLEPVTSALRTRRASICSNGPWSRRGRAWRPDQPRANVPARGVEPRSPGVSDRCCYLLSLAGIAGRLALYRRPALPGRPLTRLDHRRCGPARTRTGDLVPARYARYRLRHKPMVGRPGVEPGCSRSQSERVSRLPRARTAQPAMCAGRASFHAIRCGVDNLLCRRPKSGPYARAVGVEPTTCGFGDRCSGQLSYTRSIQLSGYEKAARSRFGWAATSLRSAATCATCPGWSCLRTSRRCARTAWRTRAAA